MNVNSSDPSMTGPECSFRASDVPKLYVRVAASIAGASQASGRFYWERENGTMPMNTAQSKGFTITADGQFRTYEVDLSGTSTWTGQISRLRFDPVSSGTTGDFVEVQFISARSPSTIWVDVASGTQTQAQARASILTGTAGLTKTGTGTLSLTVSNTYGGATRVTSGRLLLAHPRAIVSSTASVSAGATLAVASGVDAVVRGFDFSEGGRIDLTGGSLTVTGSLATAAVLAELAKGRAGGTWSGTSGIMSSTIAADLAAGRSRAIGWTDTGGSVKFASAAPGDMNLDGLIDILDVAGFLNAGKFDSGQLAVWDEGDVTYDGVVDVLDAVEFVASASFDAGPYAAAGAAVTVPEPGAGWVALAAGIAVVVGRASGGRISPMRRGLLSF